MTKFDLLKERFPNLIPVQELRSTVSIIELALHYGYKLQPQKGRSRPVLKNLTFDDTIIIKNPLDAAQQVYQRSGNFSDSGTIIDFVRNRLTTVFSTFNHTAESEFKNVTQVLYDYLRVDTSLVVGNQQATIKLTDEKPKQAFTLENFDIRPMEANNYLTKRGISPQTINSPEFTAKVVAQVSYFDPEKGLSESFLTVKEHPKRTYITFSNVAFLYQNGQSAEVTGLELRNEYVKLHAVGSDRNGSVFMSNLPAKPEQFYILESGIDALSHKQLRTSRGDDEFNAVYFSTGGQVTTQQVNTITRYIASFDKAPDWKINLAFDNDLRGHLFDLQFIQQLADTKFPISSVVVGTNRIGYLLPEQEIYQPMRDIFLDRVNAYNKSVQAQFPPEAEPVGEKELNGQLISVGNYQEKIALEVPKDCGPLRAVSQILLTLTKLDQRMRIEKALSKDFNNDLIKEIKRAKN